MECVHCNKELGSEDNFCRHCGKPVEKEIKNLENQISMKEYEIEDTIQIEKIEEEKNDELDATMIIEDLQEHLDDEYDYDEEPEEERENFFEKIKESKLPLLVLGIALVIIVSVIVLTNLDSNDIAHSELVEEFILALDNRNKSKVKKLLNLEGKEELEDMEIKGFFQYLDKNPSYINEIEKDLKDQIAYYDEKNPDIGSTETNITLRKNEDGYYLEAKPYYLNISVQKINTEIFIEDKELGISTSDNYSKEYGPFLPGIYTIKAIQESDYEKLETEEQIELIEEEPREGKVVKEYALHFDLKDINIVSDFPQAEIYLNGDPMNKTIEDLENRQLKGLSKASRLKFVINTPWGEFESEEYAVADLNNTLSVDIKAMNQELKEDMIDGVNKFLKEDMLAQEELDVGAYTNLKDPALTERAKMIAELGIRGEHKELDISTAYYDLDSVDLIYQEGTYYGTLDFKYDVLETLYRNDEEIDTNEDVKYANILLSYDEGNSQWEILAIENHGDYKGDNVLEYKF